MPHLIDHLDHVDLVSDYYAGASIRELATLYGTSSSWMRLRLLRDGVTLRPATRKGRPAPNRSWVTQEEVVAAWNRGLSERGVARLLGCSRDHVRAMRKAAGIGPRTAEVRTPEGVAGGEEAVG